jgi:hypothetical protein
LNNNINILNTLSKLAPDSPRYGNCAFILVKLSKIYNSYIPVGTAFAVECSSKKLLLTALHCLIDVNITTDELYIVKSLARNEDNTIQFDPFPAPRVCFQTCYGNGVDIAFLRLVDDITFSNSIPVCPFNQGPNQLNEDRVKTYHCPISLYANFGLDVLSATATDFTKIAVYSKHHFCISCEHTQGSSGGVLVDRNKRAVGLIVSGIRTDSSLKNFVPTNNSFIDPNVEKLNAMWDVLTANSDTSQSHSYTKAVRLDQLPNLLEYLSTH